MLPFRFHKIFYLERTRFPPHIPHLHLLSFTFHPLERFIQVYSVQQIGQDSENSSDSFEEFGFLMLLSFLIFLFSYCKKSSVFTLFFSDVWDVIPPTGQTPACVTLRMLQWVLQTNTININHATADYTYMVTLIYPIASVCVYVFLFRQEDCVFLQTVCLLMLIRASAITSWWVSFHAFNFISLNWYFFPHSWFSPLLCVSCRNSASSLLGSSKICIPQQQRVL